MFATTQNGATIASTTPWIAVLHNRSLLKTNNTNMQCIKGSRVGIWFIDTTVWSCSWSEYCHTFAPIQFWTLWRLSSLPPISKAARWRATMETGKGYRQSTQRTVSPTPSTGLLLQPRQESEYQFLKRIHWSNCCFCFFLDVLEWA